MDIVIDASVIIAVVTNEPTKGQLIKATQGASLVAPRSIHWEIGNAFSAMLKRDRVSLEQVDQAIAAYGSIPIRFVDVDLMESLEIADEISIYAYDAYLVRCALNHRCPLLTLDGGLTAAAKRKGVEIMEVF